MGFNAEQAKIKINEILTRSQIDSDPKSLELVNKKTDAFASLIDSKIKKQFVLNIAESSEPGDESYVDSKTQTKKQPKEKVVEKKVDN